MRATRTFGLDYSARVAILGRSGEPIRHVPGVAARALVGAGILAPVPASGRIREATIAQPATAHAQRIGEPTPPTIGGVRFTRWKRLDESATRIIEHHPRALWI